jgi:hypothetical protein
VELAIFQRRLCSWRDGKCPHSGSRLSSEPEGSAHDVKAVVAGEFADLRRNVRQAARSSDLSVSIVRTIDFLVVENGDYDVSADEDLAMADVIDARSRTIPVVRRRSPRRRRGRLRVPQSAADKSSVGGQGSSWPRPSSPDRWVERRSLCDAMTATR